jgi:alpha-tubulin suppressor-like RCC1 family protein
MCWGWNDDGQLGDGTTQVRGFPVAVVGLTGAAVRISASEDHTCAAMATGGAYCWGRADDGELGGGAPLDSTTPVSVLELHVPGVPALTPLASLLLALALGSAAGLVSRRALL